MKTRRPLWKVSVLTTLEAEDAVAEMLERSLHCATSSFFDLEKETSRVTAFVTHKIPSKTRETLHEDLASVKKCGLKIGHGKVSIARVRRQDWTESWKRHFRPIEIGNTLLVKPSWSKKRPQKGQAVVILNPGLSFGTGQHPTTLFCLEEIVRNHRKRRQDAASTNSLSFLDIGTGSGILAIAAAKLGYRRIQAIDFDPEAVRVARANARANGVLKTLKIAHSDVAGLPIIPKKGFDLVCANLISNLIMKERKRIIAQLNPNGVLVLAGILKIEFSQVQEAFEKSGLKLLSTRSKKEWRSGAFCFV
ncbi:MAG TPA: 50S ribosomal protein L11 methyltransferase [Candidatus Acidoferrum sp.]|jgi:ribosomal protein L11 methyltransferase|nr:50S ribosomal protein L11 methyltransferase [Candidatus Acidoferrum sp.]